ncbi:TonB-dependent hemoglobin/transferrin/lactoferrin family receptor [Shinella fusca]|uniref:TonB-dependent hemoglobin/transferrin/lactoferrin family receptor n=1 Tax=Shinella fusca TaxID=544480 RepID=UPI001614819C|nr:TonB-dependent hemoglobin/transferrin/lactoferrin family receptor [Shinella fusca]
MQARRSRSALLACTALAVFSLSAGAFAQEATKADDQSTALQPIVIKGKRVARPAGSVADTPLATQTTAETLREKEINSPADLSRIDPGVQFSSSDKGFVVRGMEGNRVTTLVDDIPLPFLTNSARSGGPSTTTNANGGTNVFSFNSVSTLDIVKGADSSRAGSGALGGAIVLRTLEPEDLIGEGRNWGGLVKGTYDSANKGVGGNVAVAKRFDATSVLFQGSYLRAHEADNAGSVGGIGFARDEANPADITEYNLLFKLRRELEGGRKIGLTAEHYNRDTDTELLTLQGGTTSSRGYQNFFGFEDSARDRVSLDYQQDEPGGFFDTVRSSIYWQNVKREAGNEGYRIPNPKGDWYRSNQLEEQSVGIVSTLGKHFDTGSFTHDLNIHGNFSYFWAQSFTEGRDGCIAGTYVGATCASLHADQSEMPDVNGSRLGLTLDDKIRYGDSAWSVTPGLGFDWFSYNPKETAGFTGNPGYSGLPDSRDGARLSPKLLVGYDVNEDIELFGQWSMAYRAPTVDELYLLYTGQGGPSQYAVVGNPDLEPETGMGFELGGNYDAGDTKMRMVGFYNKYRNFIDSDDIGPVAPYTNYTQYFNRAHVRVSGIEFSAYHELDNGLHLNGSFTYTNVRDTDTDEMLRTAVPFKAIAGIGYGQESWGVDLTGIFATAMKESKDATKFNAPGYGIANLTAWWEPPQTKGLRIQAGIYNLFDKEYWDGVALRDVSTATPSNSNTNQPLGFYSEPGRSFRVSITKTF